MAVFGGNLLAGDAHASVTLDRHVQSWQWTGSISLLTWGLFWTSALSLDAYDRSPVFLLLQCDICQFWVHLRCNKPNLVDYKYFQGSTDPWFCLSCCSTNLPFGNLTDKDFPWWVLNKNYIEVSHKSSFVLLKPSPDLALLINQFNNSSSEQQFDPQNVINFRYFDIDQIQLLKFLKKEKSLSLFRINACSLNKTFDIISVNETKTFK